MKYLFILLAIIALLLLIAAFLPNRMEITVTTTINAPKDKVWDYIKLFKNQQNYSVWVMKDPKVQLSYSWEDGSIWATQSRDSVTQGKWIQEIITLDEGNSFDVELRFEKPMVATNYAKNILEDLWSNQTKVTNMFRWDTPWPFNLMCPFIKPRLTKDMQQNMDNLKKEIEKK